MGMFALSTTVAPSFFSRAIEFSMTASVSGLVPNLERQTPIRAPLSALAFRSLV